MYVPIHFKNRIRFMFEYFSNRNILNLMYLSFNEERERKKERKKETDLLTFLVIYLISEYNTDRCLCGHNTYTQLSTVLQWKRFNIFNTNQIRRLIITSVTVINLDSSKNNNNNKNSHNHSKAISKRKTIQ